MRPPEKPAPSIADFMPVAEAGAIRSKLGRWFALNRVEFGKMMTTYRPRWEALVEKFDEQGLLKLPDDYWTDEHVRKRVVDAARQTWQRTKNTKPGEPVTADTSVPPERPAAPVAEATTQGTSRHAGQPARGFDHESIVNEDDLRRRLYGLPKTE